MIPLQQTPLARILDHETAYWTCIADVEQRDGWKLFHNVNFPRRFDPNHAGDFRAAEGRGEAIVQAIVRFYEFLGLPPVAYVDSLASPTDLIPQLLKAGFQEWTGAWNDLMVYLGPDEAKPSSAEVIVVDSRQARVDWASLIEEEADDDTRVVLRELYSREIADPRMTAYLVYIDGQPACRAELFSYAGLGRVEAVRTMAAYRGRGLAAAVVRRAVIDSLAHGNQLTYIYAEPGGDAQRLYTRLGFRTIAQNITRSFMR